MQERKVLTELQINDRLLWPVLETASWWWPAVTVAALVLGCGVTAVTIMVTLGEGTTGLNRPIFWGFMIVNFVFWVGISHAGVMISSILRLCQAEWRRPVTRAAEVLTVCSLATAALFPLIHMGRVWRFYWVFPYDFDRMLWPDVRSPLIWDPSAIFTYLTGATMFVFMALLPDLGILRDRTTGWRRTFYAFASLGWRGNPRQFKLQFILGILLSGLILPVFVSVHSIVSWDFAVSLVPAWHATVFAPYFVIGAVHSGVSGVVTMMVVLRAAFKWQDYITPDHFDALGRLLVAVATAWLYFFMLDLLFAIYGGETREVGVMEQRIFQWPWGFFFFLIIVLGYIIPVSAWMFRSVRRNIMWMFAISIMVNVSMWLERLWLIIPGLQNKERLTFDWAVFQPSLIEIMLVFSSFGLVCLGLLMFSKFFPLIPVWEEKEGQLFREEIKIGNRIVPAIVRE
ncbi:MAG: molybdopterin oxidoreductase [Dehalococcoidia bacterium]|nr:molybdopterin oxidoreductase [Dehalococcoidia bacterium]